MSTIVYFIVGLIILFLLKTIFYSSQKSRNLKALIEKYSDNMFDDNVTKDIYVFCMSDDKLKTIMQKHKATHDDISDLYYNLVTTACVKSRDGNFIPISSFAFMSSLDYLLSHKNSKHPDELAIKMMDYFGVK